MITEAQFKTKPFKHQQEEFQTSRDLTVRAILWEQGTGKTKLAIDTACWLYLTGKITGVLVVAPGGVHRNWVEDEIPAHAWDSVVNQLSAFTFQSAKADTKWHQKAVKANTHANGMCWLAISYDAFVTKTGKAAVIEFMDKHKLLYIVDEGHYIKSPTADRTKIILKSAKFSDYRRLLTGTPIANGPFDAYSQIKFLDAGYWIARGLSTFTEFKQFFGVWKKGWNALVGKEYDALVSYRRLDELQGMLGAIASRVKKEDVLDLPPKVYQKRYFTMSGEQRKLYNQMRDECVVWLQTEAYQPPAITPVEGVCLTCHGEREVVHDSYVYPCPDCGEGAQEDTGGDHGVFAISAMVKLLRLQQISCGYLPAPEGSEEPVHLLPGVNRRLELLQEVIEQSVGKVIIWARFSNDIDQIMKLLASLGRTAVRYDGQVDDDGRALAKERFQGERAIKDKSGAVIGRETVPPAEQVDFFVGNPACGATGLTLHAAKTMVYYSNSFKLIDRLQSEDRAHRIGQDQSVLYIDLVAEDTVDSKIVDSLRSKHQIAAQIQGDKLREWL